MAFHGFETVNFFPFPVWFDLRLTGRETCFEPLNKAYIFYYLTVFNKGFCTSCS